MPQRWPTMCCDTKKSQLVISHFLMKVEANMWRIQEKRFEPALIWETQQFSSICTETEGQYLWTTISCTNPRDRIQDLVTRTEQCCPVWTFELKVETSETVADWGNNNKEKIIRRSQHKSNCYCFWPTLDQDQLFEEDNTGLLFPLLSEERVQGLNIQPHLLTWSCLSEWKAV